MLPRRSNLRGINTDGNLKHRRFEKLVCSGNQRTSEKGEILWEFICNCGNTLWLTKPQLRRWMDRYPYIPYNCGCYTEMYLQQAIQAASESELHSLRKLYDEMMDKADPKSKNYINDTTVCPEWSDPITGYQEFVRWAYREGDYMEQPEDTPKEELWRFYKKVTDKHYSPETCDFREPVQHVQAKAIERHIMFTGIRYTYNQFCDIFNITEEELTEHLNNRTMDLLIHNWFHPDDPLILYKDNTLRDKEGFQRLARKHSWYIID